MICSEPFKHAVIENFAPAEILDEIVSRWPKEGWKNHSHANCDNKRSMSQLDRMPNAAKQLILDLNRKDVVDRFSLMLGHRLIPDPFITTEGKLWGGGLHEISQGGYLNVHVDFNRHPLGVWRRANLLLYLNRDWSWGGDLELWDENRRVKTVAPQFNRAILFETSEKSWHGHPCPLECPEGLTRKSIAIYYYSANAEDVETHSTVYRES